MAQMTGYASAAYVAAQTQGMTQRQMLLQLYDFAIAGCLARDTRKATTALVELIAALNFDYEDIATGLYRLYDYCLREIRAKRYEAAHKVLGDLRAAWQTAFAGTGEQAALTG